MDQFLTGVAIGQSKTAIGVSLYLREIRYTGFRSDPVVPDQPAYLVRFLRDDDVTGDVPRLDVTVDARAGQPVVIRDLLRGVEVQYLGPDHYSSGAPPQLVKGWTLEYKNGPFDKSLLTRVGQYGTDGRGEEHAWHEFAWFDKVTDDSFYKCGYTQKGDNGARLPEAQKFQPSEAMTAAAVASRVFMGAKSDDPVIRGGATLMKNMPPKWDPDTGNDFYYWYYGTLAMFQVGGDYWKVWNVAMKEALVKTQRRGGDEDGSWDPSSAWGTAGGRVYATAINILSLEIYYRYGRVLGGSKRR